MGCSGVLWDVPGVFRGCSGLFRAVPVVFRGCSGVFQGCVPGFTDTPTYEHKGVSLLLAPGAIEVVGKRENQGPRLTKLRPIISCDSDPFL